MHDFSQLMESTKRATPIEKHCCFCGGRIKLFEDKNQGLTQGALGQGKHTVVLDRGYSCIQTPSSISCCVQLGRGSCLPGETTDHQMWLDVQTSALLQTAFIILPSAGVLMLCFKLLPKLWQNVFKVVCQHFSSNFDTLKHSRLIEAHRIINLLCTRTREVQKG